MWFITSNPCNGKHLGRANNWDLSEIFFYWGKKYHSWITYKPKKEEWKYFLKCYEKILNMFIESEEINYILKQSLKTL